MQQLMRSTITINMDDFDMDGGCSQSINALGGINTFEENIFMHHLKRDYPRNSYLLTIYGLLAIQS